MSELLKADPRSPRALEVDDAESCPVDDDGWHCTAVDGHEGDHVAYGFGGVVYARWPRDPHEHEGAWVDHTHPGSMGWEYLVCACGAYTLLDDDGLPGEWQAPDGTYKPLAVPDGI